MGFSHKPFQLGFFFVAQLVVLEKGPLRTFQQIPRFQFLKTVRCLQVVGCCQQKQSQKVRSDWEGDDGWGGPQLMIWFFLVRFFMSSGYKSDGFEIFQGSKGCIKWRQLFALGEILFEIVVWLFWLLNMRYFLSKEVIQWTGELLKQI